MVTLRVFAVKFCNLTQVAAILTMNRSVAPEITRVTVTLSRHQIEALQVIALR
jgi:hypothetical protein